MQSLHRITVKELHKIYSIKISIKLMFISALSERHAYITVAAFSELQIRGPGIEDNLKIIFHISQ